VTPCPNDDTLAAFARRSLADTEHAGISDHLDSCDGCRASVLAAAKAYAPTAFPVGTPSLPPLGKGTAAAPGTKIGRFTVRRLLGAGGMGHVYEAHDPELDRAVALKILRPELTVAALTDRLLHESRLTAKVAHPAVMTVYDVGRADEVVFIAMELIRGETLGAYVARTKPGWREVVQLYERAAEGLAAAHAVGIIHRDFKPDNVLVEGDARRIVVTDFGIARATDASDETGSRPATGDVRLTATGAAIGTPAYMAPEQLLGGRVDPRADVFAFTVSLWEALFGQRPFGGASIEQILAAMTSPPLPTRAVPRRVVRALRRGLELKPERRWPDMPSFVGELAKIRTGGRRWKIAAGGAGLLAAGIATALLVRGGPANPCASFTIAYDHVALAKVLASEPAVLATLDQRANALRATHDKTCHVERAPAQDPSVAACLAARKLELEGTAADLSLDGAAHAKDLAKVVDDATSCTAPSASALFADVPADPALRRKVTALRYQRYDTENAHAYGNTETALAQATTLAHDAERVWPPLHAEMLLLLGPLQSSHGDNKQAVATLKQAAAVAESVHHDAVAVNAWSQLSENAREHLGDPERSLEYLTYAEAALDRMGHPARAQAVFDYHKGMALLGAHRIDEADKVLHEAVELSRQKVPDFLHQALLGLPPLYDDEGKIPEAIAAYREALATLPPNWDPELRVMMRTQLAGDLSFLGEHKDAIATGREAIAAADKTLPETNRDRCVAHWAFAQMLVNAQQLDEGLVEAKASVSCMQKALGERSERYGEALQVEGKVLIAMKRNAEAVPVLARACDVIAFQAGEANAQQAMCWVDESNAQRALGHTRKALALVDQALPVIRHAYGDTDRTASVIFVRGQLEGELGQRDQAIADFEQVLATESKLAVDPNDFAATQWELAKVLWRRDPKRAHELTVTALHTFDTTPSPRTQDVRAEAAEWLATNGHPKPKR
jgi:tetratricopeptide (TPR) repeat protein